MAVKIMFTFILLVVFGCFLVRFISEVCDDIVPEWLKNAITITILISFVGFFISGVVSIWAF